MKKFQNIVIVCGTIFILITAFTGGDHWTPSENTDGQSEYFLVDPNNPDGDPIRLNGKIETNPYVFPTQNGEDYSKNAISKAIITNIRTRNGLALGLLYERLGYLEFQDMNYPAARDAYNAALSIYDKDQQKLRVAEILSLLAQLEARLKNYASAKSYYEKSATLFGQLNAPVRSDYTLKVAARLPVGD